MPYTKTEPTGAATRYAYDDRGPNTGGMGSYSPVPGVDGVDAEMVLRPPWSPEMMSEEAKAALGVF